MVPVDILNKDEQDHAEAIVVDTLLTELGQFQKWRAHFQSCHVWNIAEVENILAHEWHQQKYSLPFTKQIGKFACVVTSETTGVGGAE